MSGGGSKQQTTTQEVKLPAWLDAASQQTLARAQTVADRPYEAYGGDRLAGLTPDTLQAQQMVRDQAGQAGGILTGLAGQAGQIGQGAAPQVQAGSLAGTNLAPYLNPYTQNVLQSSLGLMDQQRQLAQQSNEDRAIGANAFGGSRMAVQQAATDTQYARQAGDLAAQLQGQNFSQAQAAATADINRNLQAQTTNAGNYLQNLGLGLQGIQLAGSLTGAAQTANRGDIDALGAVGQQNQQQAQAGLDLAAQRWADERNYPLQQLQIMQGALQAVPYGQTTVSTGAQQGANPAMGALGGAASGASMGSMFGPWGTAIGAVAGGAMGYFGSRR